MLCRYRLQWNPLAEHVLLRRPWTYAHTTFVLRHTTLRHHKHHHTEGMNEMPGSAFATHGGIPYSLRRCSVRRVAERTVTTPVRPSRPNQRAGSAVAHSLACGATQLRVLLVAGVPHRSAELAGVHRGVPHLGSLACTGNTVSNAAPSSICDGSRKRTPWLWRGWCWGRQW